ncbi:MAG: hypothetical protein QM610_11150 [Chitinophagaceae bacterium]
MRKTGIGCLVLFCFSSCQYVNNTLETLKNNVKNSVEMPNILPSIYLKPNNEDGTAKDSTRHLTLSSFFSEKFDL